MDLGRYPSEVRAIADELLELLKGELAGPASIVMNEHREMLWSSMSREDTEKALKFLSQTPSARAKVLSKMEGKVAAALILRARYLGVVAAQALHFADRFQFIKGSSYRSAADSAAREVLRHRIEPTCSEVYPNWVQSTAQRSGGSRWTLEPD